VTDAATAVFDAHTTGSYLDEHGFLLREQFPVYRGDVPRRVKERVARSGETQSRLDGSREELSSAVSHISVLI
jgi:molybdate/tungstate transport system substrate-binding protein